MTKVKSSTTGMNLDQQALPNDLLLRIRDLAVSFASEAGQVPALNRISLDIPQGKTLCLVGESGSGKSVTARSILRILAENATMSEGEILYNSPDGQTIDLAQMQPNAERMRRLRGDEISMIYQEPMTALSPLYSIGNQIVEALRWHRKLSEKDARAEALQVLRQVKMPEPERRIDSFSFELSGGQRQRAMIAMALICKPRLLIADEPTTALDVTTQAVILDLLRDLQEEHQMSVLFITHDLGVVAEIADDVAVMYRGNIVERGTVERVLTEPAHPYTRDLMACLPKMTGKREKWLKTMSRAELDADINALPGQAMPKASNPRDEAALSPVKRALLENHKPAYDQEPILRVKQLAKHFTINNGLFAKPTHVHSLNGVSLDLWPGETLGLVGESGCGKSTLGQTILGLHKPTEGTVEVKTDNGYFQMTGASRRQLKKHWHDIRMVFQDPDGSFNPRLTVFDIIAEVLRMHPDWKKRSTISDRVKEVMAMVHLEPSFIDRYPHAFSGGQRQRIGIARALAPHPRIIIADEPVSALDVSVQARVLNLFKELQAELGLTYLFISHDLSVVRHISDRIAVMKAGKIVELATADEIFAAPKHPYTRMLLEAVPNPVPRRLRGEEKRTASRKDLESELEGAQI